MTDIGTISEKIKLRDSFKLVLPKEHGSWSLALEPLALGMLVVPSAAGGALVCAAVAGFFLRRPLKLVLSGKADPRVPSAIGAVIALSMLAIASLALAMTIGGMAKLWPLIPAAVAGIGFVWFDSRNAGREEAAELCGVIAFGFLPATFGTLASWSVAESMALAAVMLARSVPTVLFVRVYLRRNKGHVTDVAPALIAAGIAPVLATWLVFSHLAPWPAIVLAFLLAGGTFWALRGNRRFTARKIGIAEMTFGVMMVLVLASTWKTH